MLPPDHSLRLCDYFGNYVIELRCRHCQHSRALTARALGRIAGGDTRLAALGARLRCSRCQARGALLTLTFARRPRGWNKNPS
jgi:hypothetical protein